MRRLAIILFLFTTNTLFAQRNRVKFGIIAIPFSSGFGIGSAGYERLNANLSNSWQFSLNASTGQIAADVGVEKRLWTTVEKTFYRKAFGERFTWSYSFFTEIGSRVKKAGYIKPSPDRIFRETKSFELNPGAAFGLQFRMGKRWRMEGIIGPKFVIANGKDYYYNSISQQEFTELANETRAGFRLMGLLSYQF